MLHKNVPGNDLVALFLCLFFLRHVSSPPCISQTGIIPEKCEAIVNAGRILLFSLKFLPQPRFFRTYSQYITLSEMLQHINVLFRRQFSPYFRLSVHFPQCTSLPNARTRKRRPLTQEKSRRERAASFFPIRWPHACAAIPSRNETDSVKKTGI